MRDLNVSIIIPTRNRESLLDATLKSIISQKGAEDISFEVIVVDNGSTDGTKSVCDINAEFFENFVYHYDDTPGQLTGRHKGLALAKGSTLAYLDDDVLLNADWISSLSLLVNQYPEVSIFGGPSLPLFLQTPPAWLESFWETTPYGGRMCLPLSLIDLKSDALIIEPLYVFGLNFSIRKKALKDLGGFHPDCIPSTLQKFQGDGETGLAIKASINGLKALHASSLSLRHQIPPTRLTEEYFKTWSFYSGVCHSFTDLRSQNSLYPGFSPEQPTKQSPAKRLINKIRRMIAVRQNKAAQRLQNSLTREYLAGYQFHQNAFLGDPKVKSWVLRKNYFDYALPYENKCDS